MVEFFLGAMFGVMLSALIEWRVSRYFPRDPSFVDDPPEMGGPAPQPTKGRTMWDREDPYVPKSK